VPIAIEDPADQRLAPFADLRHSAGRDLEGRCVVEGRRAISVLLRSWPSHVEAVLLTTAAQSALAVELQQLDPTVPLYLVAAGVLTDLVRFRLHQGALAIARRPALQSWRTALASPGRCGLLVLDRVADPDNVGGCFRNALAFGVSAVLALPGTADHLYRKVIRTSLGATLAVPCSRIASAEVGELLATLDCSGFQRVALVAQGGIPLYEHKPAPRWALCAGNEGDGLGRAVAAACDVAVTIPMMAGCDSLNVNVAVAIALSWWRRDT
jgi:tRNA G18 (ribose-2'-O)-methylase SpoU